LSSPASIQAAIRLSGRLDDTVVVDETTASMCSDAPSFVDV
jgi:hypothetical protein